MSSNERDTSDESIRLLVLSDLHLEFGALKLPSPQIYDIALLAGDIWNGTKAVRWASDASTFAGKPVVLVPGNHEFYGRERKDTLERMREHAAGSNVHLLDRNEVVLNGVRLLGATLWTDFALDADHGTPVDIAMGRAEHGSNDFAGRIRERRSHTSHTSHTSRSTQSAGSSPGSRPPNFTPQDAAREHALSRAWLQERLDRRLDAAQVWATVVVTHHGPSGRSMDSKFVGSMLNPCFYSELPQSYFETAELWVHGHTHSSSDYQHHRTRVVANPRGYMRRDGSDENASFKPDLVIRLERRTPPQASPSLGHQIQESS